MLHAGEFCFESDGSVAYFAYGGIELYGIWINYGSMIIDANMCQHKSSVIFRE